MSDVFREIDGSPIRWDDGIVIHSVEGGWGPLDEFRILWTDCDRDVPANKAKKSDRKITCKHCLSKIKEQDQ